MQHVLLLAATVLCGLVAGLLWTFAVVVMPGIQRLDDVGFIRAFQEMDGVIQRNNPMFLVVWLGALLTLVAAAVLQIAVAASPDRWLLMTTALLYVASVQAPTFAVNVPLNNALQRVRPDALSAADCAAARSAFEARWNRANLVRTWGASLTLLLLALLLSRMG